VDAIRNHRPLIGISASLHDFGDYGGVGVQRPLLAATEPQRNEFELALVPGALARGIPILGMCRGLQVLNVALGSGTAEEEARIDPRSQRVFEWLIDAAR
jgi:gamma-glutamyl-gamma-aminobutyrate hydrolase PuuD